MWRTSQHETAAQLAAGAVSPQADRLVVIGDQATIRSVASVLANTRVALRIVPVGSGGNLARSIGAPTEQNDAIAAALGESRSVVDLMKVSQSTEAIPPVRSSQLESKRRDRASGRQSHRVPELARHRSCPTFLVWSHCHDRPAATELHPLSRVRDRHRQARSLCRAATGQRLAPPRFHAPSPTSSQSSKGPVRRLICPNAMSHRKTDEAAAGASGSRRCQAVLPRWCTRRPRHHRER